MWHFILLCRLDILPVRCCAVSDIVLNREWVLWSVGMLLMIGENSLFLTPGKRTKISKKDIRLKYYKVLLTSYFKTLTRCERSAYSKLC